MVFVNGPVRAAVRVIAAVSQNGVIGVRGKLPWKLPLEWSHFRRTTRGGTLILGRKCHEDNGKALSGCSTVVVTTRDTLPFASDTEALGVRAANSLGAAVALAQHEWPERPIWICGGEQIYQETCKQRKELGCEELVLTRVGLEIDVSAYAERTVTRFPLQLALAHFDHVTASEDILDIDMAESDASAVPLRIEWRQPSAVPGL